MTPPADDELRALVRGTDPWAGLDPSDRDAVGAAARALEPVLLAPDHGGSRREELSGHSRRVGLAVAAGGAALTLAAAGVLSSAWTGEYANGTPDGMLAVDGRTWVNADGTDTSQLVDPSAPGGLEVVAGLAPREVTLPHWLTWDEIVAHQLAPLQDVDAAGRSWGVMSADGFRSMYYSVAIDAWAGEWVLATDVQDAGRARAASAQWATLLDLNRWVWAPDQAHLPYELHDRAQAGDRDAVVDHLSLNAPDWVLERVGLPWSGPQTNGSW